VQKIIAPRMQAGGGATASERSFAEISIKGEFRSTP